MFIWELSVTLLLIFTFFSLGTNYLKFLFITPIIFLVGSLRDYGFDYHSYYSMFADDELISILVFQQFSVEPFYLYLNNIFYLLSADYKLGIIFLISYFLRISSIFIFFKTFSLRILSFLIYINIDLLSRDFGQIRNGLAASLFCLIFALFYKKKCVWISYFTPFMFHYSYILVPIMEPITRLYNKRIYLTLYVIISLLLYSFISGNIFLDFNYAFFSKLRIYSNPDSHYMEAARAPFTLFLSIGLVIYLFLKFKYLNNITVSILTFLTIAICCYIFFSFSPVISSRVLTIFTPLLIFAIPISVKLLFKNFSHDLFFLLVFFLTSTFIFRFYNFYIIFN
jgi:hypothetical protein